MSMTFDAPSAAISSPLVVHVDNRLLCAQPWFVSSGLSVFGIFFLYSLEPVTVTRFAVRVFCEFRQHRVHAESDKWLTWASYSLRHPWWLWVSSASCPWRTRDSCGGWTSWWDDSGSCCADSEGSCNTHRTVTDVSRTLRRAAADPL